ncbi:MAG: ATP-binding protein [archaeon]
MRFFENFKKKKTPQANLEQRVQETIKEEIVEKNENKLKRVQFCEEFYHPDFAASKIWDYISKKGEVVDIGDNSHSSDGKCSGSPQMRKADNGEFYPIGALIKTKIDGSDYNIKIGETYSAGSKLKVSVECEVGKEKAVEEMFSKARYQPVIIEKKFEDEEPLRKMYEFIKKNSDSIKIFESGLNKSPKMIIDERFGLLPVEASIHAKIEDTEYQFIFSDNYHKSISIECPVEKTEFVSSLLEKMVTRVLKDDEKGIKSLDFAVSVKEYNWEMVGGLGEIKKELEQYIEWPMSNPDLFKKLDVKMPKGILLIGPPGNGKTTIAKILANSTNSIFYTVSPKDINSKWVGQTEQNWGRLFKMAREDSAKGNKVLIFIDEIDGFYVSRDDMDKYSRMSFGQFCQEMEGISDLENIVIIGATNRYKDLDEALVRPGRFTKKIYIGTPDETGREEILKIYLKNKPLSQDVNIAKLAKITPKYSGAMLKEICESAAYNTVDNYCSTKGISIKDIDSKNISDLMLTSRDFDLAMEAQKKYMEKEKDIGFKVREQ